MLKNVTRSRVIQGWFAAVLLVVVACLALGVAVTVSTAALLLALSLVPPAIVMFLWPAPPPLTASDVIRQRD